VYCPKCSTQNSDDVRFCRLCGAPLELVALALDGKLVRKRKSSKTKASQSEETPEVKRAKGTGEIVSGSTLIAVSLLILLGPMPFIGQAFPWLVIWSAIFGWMAIWGTIELAQGLGHVLGANRIPSTLSDAAPGTPNLLADPQSENALVDRSASYEIVAPPSVTETTTRHLNPQTK
jgi:hypothetical protein